MSHKPPKAAGKIQNEVHRDTVHFQNVRKEMRYFDKNRMENFQLNPMNSR